jgi:xylulokinase
VNALALDLGTTAAKAAVVSPDGRILGSGAKELVTTFGAGGSAEQDAELVWEAVLTAARNALDKAGTLARRDVRVVCATSQWASVVPVDASGHPVGPMLMWLDQRGGQHLSVITKDSESKRHWLDIHGLSPSLSLTHVLFLQHDRPDIHSLAATYLEPADYLSARLCGRLAATGCTAMPFTLTDQRSLGDVTWSDQLINRAGVDRKKLPELVPSMSILGPLLGTVAHQLGLRTDTVVVTGANDTVAAAVGTNAIASGHATVVMGTTSVLTTHHPHRIIADEKFLATMPSALNDRFSFMAEAGLGGKVLELFLQEISPDSGASVDDAFANLSPLVEGVPVGADGLLFLPWVLGSAAPRVDGRHRGAFLGVSMKTTRAHMIRAVLEGLALQMRWLVDEVEATLHVRYETLRFAGGGAQCDAWAQVMADVLARPIDQLSEPRHANARGAGLLGLAVLDEVDLNNLEAIVPIARRYEPSPGSAALFADRYDIYRDLHDRLAEPVSRLRRPPTR